MTLRIVLWIALALLVLGVAWLALSMGRQSTEPESVKVDWPVIIPDPNPAYARLAWLSALPPRARSAPTMRAASVSPPIVVRVGDPSDSDFDRLASCESGARWNLNTGNGYYGGLQFDAQTWRSNGGAGLPHEHPRETQIDIARRLWRARGWAPWPSCSRQLGWR